VRNIKDCYISKKRVTIEDYYNSSKINKLFSNKSCFYIDRNFRAINLGDYEINYDATGVSGKVGIQIVDSQGFNYKRKRYGKNI